MGHCQAIGLCCHAVWERILCALQRERKRPRSNVLHITLKPSWLRPKNEVPNIATCVRPIAWRHDYKPSDISICWLTQGLFLPFILFTWFRTARAAARANIGSWFEEHTGHISAGLVAALGLRLGLNTLCIHPWLIRLALRRLESGAYSDGQCCHLALLTAARSRGKQNHLVVQILQRRVVNYFTL